jgi:hypothetical protein
MKVVKRFWLAGFQIVGLFTITETTALEMKPLPLTVI